MASDLTVEDVPRFTRRYWDHVVEGSNGTIIILGTDRAKNGPANIDDGIGGAGTATVHIIAGRSNSDPDMTSDASFLYLSKKTKVDTNLGLTAVEKKTDEKPSAILKSDAVRIVGRKDIKICANDDEKHYIFMDGEKIKIRFDSNATVEIIDKKITVKIGSNVIEMDDKQAKVDVNNTKMTLDGSKVKIDSPKIHLVGGCQEPWDKLFNELIEGIKNHNHMSSVGPTTPATAGPATVSAVIPKLLSAKEGGWDVKVKT